MQQVIRLGGFIGILGGVHLDARDGGHLVFCTFTIPLTPNALASSSFDKRWGLRYFRILFLIP